MGLCREIFEYINEKGCVEYEELYDVFYEKIKKIVKDEFIDYRNAIGKFLDMRIKEVLDAKLEYLCELGMIRSENENERKVYIAEKKEYIELKIRYKLSDVMRERKYGKMVVFVIHPLLVGEDVKLVVDEDDFK